MSSFPVEGSQKIAPPSSEPLLHVMKAVFGQFCAFIDSLDMQSDEMVFYDLLQQLDELQERIDSEGVISSNETVDDVSTPALQYLFVPYCYAKVCGFCPVMARRLHYLTVANGYMQRFVERCVKIHAVEEGDVASLIADDVKKPCSDATRRQQKIANFKRERECKQRIEFLRQYVSDFTSDSTGLDAEAETRELTLLQMQHYARSCVDDIEMNSQEIVMLKLRLEEGSREDGGSRLDGRMRQFETSESGSTGGPFYAREERRDTPGLNVTHLNKIGDEIVMKRELIKADIFKSHIAPPTMTLEEFADLEVAQALERERAEKDNPPSVTRTYKQLEGDGDEDNLDLVDQATMKARDWDLWKEDNPKGWGNKNKRG